MLPWASNAAGLLIADGAPLAGMQALEENIVTALTACDNIAQGFDEERMAYERKVCERNSLDSKDLGD